ncbi:unnamed protein product [Peronospora belbahrii]|uniref:Uncharacterized protein n=1 Tax=Peronospora belbahrii TaxID=622444 RepID=A0ABN8CL98_9STRA|nr:unnamed protein product [Peronospora belbahrii]
MGWVLLKTISEEPLEGRPSTNVQRFRDLELQWWKARPSDELQMFVMQFGLQPKSMSFFGEVFFLLCGLKACVLLSNLPVMWRQSFASDVVLASGLLHLAPSVTTSRCSIALYAVGTRLKTPAEYELTGDLVLADRLHADFNLAEQSLRLIAAILDNENACVRLFAPVDLSMSR